MDATYNIALTGRGENRNLTTEFFLRFTEILGMIFNCRASVCKIVAQHSASISDSDTSAVEKQSCIGTRKRDAIKHIMTAKACGIIQESHISQKRAPSTFCSKMTVCRDGFCRGKATFKNIAGIYHHFTSAWNF